tara:strand:+ start:5086 stop:6363 length:1278 start_codon:yes stop_codon:yes gene_type:complete
MKLPRKLFTEPAGADVRHILIVNQHGENRGDEAALRAMVSGFEKELGNCRFTVIAQFRDPQLSIPFNEDVTFLNLRMPPVEFFRFLAFSLLGIVGIRAWWLLSRRTEKMVDAFGSADLVVSAPGGPYFGDLYADHEIVHWYYVWLACRHRKKLFLYAPSAGPFRNRLLNPIRKWLFRKFDVICVRETISQGLLQTFMGPDAVVHVTADSAIQQIVPAAKREDYFTGARTPLRNKFVVAVSAIEYAFPGEPDPAASKDRYLDCLVSAIEFLAEEKECHFLLIPQLYGAYHTDVPFLETLSKLIPASASWEIVSSELDSNVQRSLFGMSDICIASRYHPQIFAATANVPGVCIYYEHKALGFMRALNLEHFAFDIRRLEPEPLLRCLQEVVRDRDQLSATLSQRVPAVRELSARTTQLAVELLNRPA